MLGGELANEAIRPKITRSRSPGETVHFEPLKEGAERGYYRVMTAMRPKGTIHAVTEVLAILRSIRRAP